MTLAKRLDRLRREIDRRSGRRSAVLDRLASDEAKLAETVEIREKLLKAIEVVQAATESRRQELHDRVEVLVTRGLRAVFDRSDYEFALAVQLRRDVFGVKPILRSKFGEKTIEADVVEGHGGGVVDVVSFLLRVVVLSLARPRLAPVMILDESFRNVSPEFLRGVATLLGELSRSVGIQFILVTHKDSLLDAADVVYRVGLVGGASRFKLEHDLRDEVYHRKPKRGEVALDRTSAFDGIDLAGAPGEIAEIKRADGSRPAKLRKKRKRRKRKTT